MDALAYEEAATWFERGLAVAHDAKQRGTLLLALGDARHGSGTKEAARDAICEAAAIAREIGDPELLALAALGFSTSGAAVGIGTEWGVVDQQVVDLLEEALDVLEPGDSPLRARLLARLGAALYFSHDVDRLTELSSTALEMSHRVGDKRSMAMALAARHSARWLPGTVEERRDIAQEVLNLAEVVGDRELILQGYAFLVAAYMELNDRAAVDRYIDAAGRLAEAVKRPQYLWWKKHWDASIALLEGRLDEAEQLIGDALQIGQENQGHNALNTFAIQTLILRLHQGRARELEGVVRASIDSYPDLPSWWTGLVVIGVGTGDESLLRESYDHLARDRFGVLPRDAMWHAAMVMLAWAACSLDDTEGARTLYEMLSPLEGRNVHVGAGAVYFGSVDRYLGMLALQLGDWDRAEAHFTHGLQMQDAMGGRIFSVVTLLNISDLLRTRNGPGDAQRAIDTCHEARRRAEELKIDALSAWVEREVERASAVAGQTP
jgi:tetratricopeptide (TPR) repeat protein